MLLLAAPLVLAIGGSGGRGLATAAVGDCTPDASWGTVRGDLAAQVAGLVNQHRAGIGLGALAESAPLNAAAVWKARHMAAYGYLDHNDPAPPVQRQWSDRFVACGYTAGGRAENIASGQRSAASVMQSWLSSPGHRANIEGASFRAIGVGAAAAPNGTLYWAQTFGTVAGGSPPPSPRPPAPPPAPPPSPPPAVAPPTPPAPPPSPPVRPITAKAPPSTPKPTSPASASGPKGASSAPPSGPKGTSAAPAPPAPPSPQTAAAPAQRTPALEASRLLEWGPRPRAGHMFTGRLMILEPETRRRVETGRVTCNAHSAGRRVWVGIHRFRKGFVVCRWHVPQIARHHRLIGTIRVHAGGKRTARWFSRIVR